MLQTDGIFTEEVDLRLPVFLRTLPDMRRDE